MLGWVRDGGKAWLTLTPGSRPRRTARRGLEIVVAWCRSEPWRHAFAVRVLRQLPWLDARLRLSLRPPSVEASPSDTSPADEFRMSLRAQKILVWIHKQDRALGRGDEGR